MMNRERALLRCLNGPTAGRSGALRLINRHLRLDGDVVLRWSPVLVPPGTSGTYVATILDAYGIRFEDYRLQTTECCSNYYLVSRSVRQSVSQSVSKDFILAPSLR